MQIGVHRSRTCLVLCIATLIGCLLPCGVIASALYTYDAVGRVTSALYDNGTCVAYLYDANGNRTSQNTTLSGTPVSPVWGSGVWGCFAWTATP